MLALLLLLFAFMPLVDNTLILAPRTEARDRIDVEVGDSKEPSQFLPQMKIARWSNEVNLSIRADVHPQAVVEEKAGNRIHYVTPDWELHQFPVEASALVPEGGFEFEWLLLKKPPTNRLRTTIQSKGLNFFRQPATEMDPVEGGSVPEHVRGSFAVYHASKGGLVDALGMNYRSGKAWHIYRPEAIDANGNRAWCDHDITPNGRFYDVTVPQAFLDSAVYPVRVDPTFGYTTAGASNTQFIGVALPNAIGSLVSSYTASAGDTLTLLSAYADNAGGGSGPGPVTLALYSIVSSIPEARLGSTANTPNVSTTAAWMDTSALSEAMSAGVAYNVALSGQALVGASSFRIYYDTGSAPGRRVSSNTTLEDPFADSGTSDSGTHYSLYATYTAGGASTPKGPLSNPFSGPFGGPTG